MMEGDLTQPPEQVTRRLDSTIIDAFISASQRRSLGMCSFGGGEMKRKSISCTQCQARGHMPCPICSNFP
ncbi:PREDICTED: uncharacterized protein LOC104605481 [Nelumbo nucifera]|uniref:Uncharacterized protein LOC104605481 n=1 Tax=Nelumbo nucifera TaxID=4432 RepID=A0A1U8AQL8_NELNU|nr:PREDICTED: uncharacterized protein LOC104605481 [Nelumbo nucifera]